MTVFRKHLSALALLSTIHQQFLKLPDPCEFTKNLTISISDHLMSGLAVFGLKCPSLLDYDRKRFDDVISQNLRDLYHVNNSPSDTYLRERLDHVDPDHIRPAFKKVFAAFQRGKGLEEFEYLDGHVLISGDGTGQFSSNSVCCPQCCVKEHQNGTKTYYHQMFGACIVHPDKKNVILSQREPLPDCYINPINILIFINIKELNNFIFPISISYFFSHAHVIE